MTTTLSAAQARRVLLAAQGLARSRPSRRVREADFAAYMALQGVLQLDTVNVLARAHYLPFFSRYGAYDTAALDEFLWGAHDGHSTHHFEHWGHEASVMPLDVLPAMHHRMIAETHWKTAGRERLERERPGLIDAVRATVDSDGPVTAGEIEHLAPRARRAGPWWDASDVKAALEYHFHTGRVAASRGRHFSRTYDSTERAWGVAAADAVAGDGAHPWGLPANLAHQQLFDRGLASAGIGTVKDICDHFRLPYKAGPKTPDVEGGQVWAASAVERGLAEWVEVQGWSEPALFAVGGPTVAAPWHRAASDPGRATGAALLSPFDPVCWFRPRLERMFGMDYRIEIYTPAEKRVYGYYTLPFLMGDQMAGRLDLKADRKAGVLRVEAAWAEGPLRGVKRRPAEEVASAMTTELARMASWLSLDNVAVADRGNLSRELGDAVAAAGLGIGPTPV